MNDFLKELFNNICIDVEYLKNEFLSKKELEKLSKKIKSYNCLIEKDVRIFDDSDNLDLITTFIECEKDVIIDILNNKGNRAHLLKKLYISPVISGSLESFYFDLSKFPKSYIDKNKTIRLYRIGRYGENINNLGCSWSKNKKSLKNFKNASVIRKGELKKRPVFEIEIKDKEILFEGNKLEGEMVLKKDFKYEKIRKKNRGFKKQLE